MAFCSLSVGIYQGIHRSIDFQWSGAHLIAHHQDPWKLFLRDDPQHQIILSQQPDYLPELYVLFFPFGLMSFDTASLLCGFFLARYLARDQLLQVQFCASHGNVLAPEPSLQKPPIFVASASYRYCCRLFFGQIIDA